MAENAQLRIGDKTIELPIVVGTEGERAIDISKLRKETGLITLDPGYVNTGSCQSAITFIDGDRGILRYRGISIEELAANCTFLEVAYLLVYGSLPTAAELESFNDSITFHTMIHEDFKRFFGAMPKDAHPMAACSAAIGALATSFAVHGHDGTQLIAVALINPLGFEDFRQPCACLYCNIERPRVFVDIAFVHAYRLGDDASLVEEFAGRQ